MPKTGIPGHFGAKIRYILEPSTNQTPGALRLATSTSYLFLAEKVSYTWFCLLRLDFNGFWRFLIQTDTIH